MSKELLEDRRHEGDSVVRKKHPRHPLTMENTPEETIRRMESFPERAAKLREIIRGLREKDAR
jgi:hypothetical protein